MRSSLLALAVLLGACGSAHDLSFPSASFAVVKGHVDLAAVAARAKGRPVIAAIVWGRVPSLTQLCFEAKGDPVVDASCPDPFGFFPGAVDATTLLDLSGNGDFEFPLAHLPSANVLIGTDVDHIAYATILVVADENRNGALDLVTQARGGGGPGGGGPGGGGPGGGGSGTPTPAPTPDEIIGASFATLLDTQQRLTFREGSLEALKLFYPAPTCDTPKAGFSVLRTGSYTDATAQCDDVGLDQPIEVAILSPKDSQALACRSGGGGRGGRIEQPDLKDPPKKLQDPHCVNKDLLVTTTKDLCPSLTVMSLFGCASDINCKTPEWDERKSPPGWWPCGP